MGSRSPDEAGYPSATATLKNSGNLLTNAAGSQAFACLPIGNQWGYQANAVTGPGSVTWAAGASNTIIQDTALQNMATLDRTVGWGVRLSTEVPLTTASGHIWVAHVPMNYKVNYPYNDWPTTEAQFAELPLSEKYSLVELSERPLIIAGRAFDDGIYRYREVGAPEATTYTIESSAGWCAILILAINTPASSYIINVETVHHIEYLQNSNALYGFIDSQPSPYSPVEMQRLTAAATASPVAILEPSVDSFSKAADMFESAITNAGRIMTKAAPVAQGLYGLYRFATKHKPMMASIPAIEYKSNY